MGTVARFVQLTFHRMLKLLDVDQRRQFERDAFFVLCMGAGAYVVLALFSFRPDHPWLYGIANDLTAQTSATGSFGNRLAGMLIFYFGITAGIWPLILLHLGWQIRTAAFSRTFISLLTGWLLALIALMAIVTAIQPTFPLQQFAFNTGGVFGESLQAVLSQSLGGIGSQIILWTVLLSSSILIAQLDLRELTSLLRRRTMTDESTVDAPQPDTTIPSTAMPVPVQEDVPVQNEPTLFSHEKGDARLSPLDEKGDSRASPFSSTRPYTAPSLATFRRADERMGSPLTPRELEMVASVLVKTLEEFGVTGKIVGWQPGPVVTVYEYQPEAGIKQSKVLSLMDDLALSLKVDSIFINPVPGKRALGIQVPNQRRELVCLGDVLSHETFTNSPSPLTFAMGKTISGQPFCADLTTMPHLLAAGATGTGKSVAINSLLCSIIMKSSPDDVRMILVDPKMLELSVYDGIPHLLMPVITEPDRASSVLKWAANEMERRYKIMQHAQVRNIGGFNIFWEQANEERREQIHGLMNDHSITRLPYILLVIDELADLMLTAPKDVENSIQRLAQKARASGIHMVLATQRPSVDVITGVIKANLPCRLSFQVVSKHDSRTILDQMGAEKLLGKGDLLLQRPGVGKLERLQGALVTDEEVLTLVAATKASFHVVYDERAMGWIDEEVTRALQVESNTLEDAGGAGSDPKWDDAINIARTHGVISASFLQRHLQIGYNRAARIVEGMEAKGMVAKADGSKPRRWLGVS